MGRHVAINRSKRGKQDFAALREVKMQAEINDVYKTDLSRRSRHRNAVLAAALSVGGRP